MNSHNVKEYMHKMGLAARAAARLVAQADTATKNRALQAMADSLRQQMAQVLAANAEDVVNARANGLDAAAVDRLTLTEKTVNGMAEGLLQIAQLADPVGEISNLTRNFIADMRLSEYAEMGFQFGNRPRQELQSAFKVTQRRGVPPPCFTKQKGHAKSPEGKHQKK